MLEDPNNDWPGAESEGEWDPVADEWEERTTGGAPAAVLCSNASVLATGVTGVAINARSLSMDPGVERASPDGRENTPGLPLEIAGAASDENDEPLRGCFTNKLGFAGPGDSTLTGVAEEALLVLSESNEDAFGPNRLIVDIPKEFVSMFSFFTTGVVALADENKDLAGSRGLPNDI